MEIIGYSERGAMNALFYGMALKEDDEAMNKFIHLASIENDSRFSDFVIYSEFSLSDFGDPDMMITAKNKEGKDVLFFIEAKVSCGSYFDLSKQWERHKKDTSNLFFQLRLKKYFFERFKRGNLDETTNDGSETALEWLTRLAKRGKGSGENLRYIGKNVVVNRIVNILKEAQIGTVYYIAIIPKQEPNIEIKNDEENDKEYKDIHFVTWEDIKNDGMLKDYVELTIDFNKDDKGKSQILNNPKHQ